MFQGGYNNFAAKRAARHGKTKQYKESLKNQKVFLFFTGIDF